MPEISRFYGVRVTMNPNDHRPAHFHAEYGGYEVLIEIATGRIIKGELPRRAMQMLTEWAELHRAELAENWNLREQQMPMNKIEPLP